MDLMSRRKGLTGAELQWRFVAVSSDLIRLMRRPESMKTRSMAAAAELEQQRSSERKKTTEGGEWKRSRSCLFIRECVNRRARKSRRPNNDYPTEQTPRFPEDIKNERSVER